MKEFITFVLYFFIMGYKISLFSVIILSFCSCSGEKAGHKQASTEEQKISLDIPEFNADSAYRYTQNQVDFGPRVPGTLAHQSCGNYLSGELKRFDAQVVEQEAKVYLYNGKAIDIKNIIGSFQPENKSRILLCAHWDTRPFADHDSNTENHRKPIDGANDGAGSCAVLLEIARQIQIKQPAIGIDIIFFDAEDWGAPSFDENHQKESGYCLGSEYWSKNPHVKNYTARFGILLDMVGAPDATFHKEYFSMKYASNIVQKVWETAHVLGHSQYFINAEIGGIEDDHVQIIKNRNIPCIDIIHYDPKNENGFGSYWHTMEDNMKNISKTTLQAVGETVLSVIYREKN